MLNNCQMDRGMSTVFIPMCWLTWMCSPCLNWAKSLTCFSRTLLIKHNLIRKRSKVCSIGVPPGTRLGNTLIGSQMAQHQFGHENQHHFCIKVCTWTWSYFMQGNFPYYILFNFKHVNIIYIFFCKTSAMLKLSLNSTVRDWDPDGVWSLWEPGQIIHKEGSSREDHEK